MDEIIDISKLIMDDGKKCLGHKSFDSMEKFIGKNRVKNLNSFMKKHESNNKTFEFLKIYIQKFKKIFDLKLFLFKNYNLF